MFEFEFNHFGYLKHLDKSSKFIACTHFRVELAKKDPNWPKVVKAAKSWLILSGVRALFARCLRLSSVMKADGERLRDGNCTVSLILLSTI